MRDVRKLNRLGGWDYATNGAYYLTICTQYKAKVLWEPLVGERSALPQVTQAPPINGRTLVGERSALPQVTQPLSEYGRIVQYAIEQIHIRYPMVTVDTYVIMPNHIHMLVVIATQGGSAVRSPTISTVVNQMKGYVTKQIGKSIWQKSFNDRVLRNEKEYLTKWNYIDENPLRWMDDEYYI